MPSKRIEYVWEGFVHGVPGRKKNSAQNTNREISSDMGVILLLL